MKIVICVTNEIMFDQRMHRIATTLTNANHDVIITGRVLKSTPTMPAFIYKTKQIKCLFNKGPLFYFEYNVRLFIFLLFLKTDLIYACDPDTLPAAASAKTLRSKKGIYDSHEIFIETPEITNRPFIKKVWSIIEFTFGSRMDVFITVNDSLVEILSKRLKVPFNSIRNMPFLTQNVPSQNKENIILYQGVLNEGRGLECAINSLKLLPDYKLVLAGDGDVKNDLLNLVSKNNLETQVTFLGKLTPDELKQITQKAKYGLNLLTSDSPNYYYSLANKFFDYMAVAVPSINMEFPQYQKYCSQYGCGITIDNLSPISLSNAIIDIDNTPQLYSQLQANSIKAHNDLNWQNEEIKLLALIPKG